MDALRKLVHPDSDDQSDDTPLLSDLLAATGGFLKKQQRDEVLDYAKAMQMGPETERNKADKEWLADFVLNVNKLFLAEDEMEDITRKRKNMMMQKELLEQQSLAEQEQEELIKLAQQKNNQQTNNLLNAKNNPNTQVINANLMNQSPSTSHYMVPLNASSSIIPPALPPPNRPLPIPPIKLNELVIKPEKFEGKRDCARLWLEDYEVAGIANSWSPETKVKYFSTFLAGPARNWFAAIAQPKINPQTKWDELKTMFVRFYIGLEEQESVRRELRRCRQRRDEVAIDFISRITRLINIAEPSLSEAEKVRDIKLKLKDSYQDRLVGQKPKTLEELNDLCQEIEDRLDANKRSSIRIGNKPYESKTNVPQPNKAAETKVSNYECDFCNKKGHTSDRCWTKHGKPVKIKTSTTAAAIDESEKSIDTISEVSEPIETKPVITTLRRSACGAVVALTTQPSPSAIVHPIKLNKRKVEAMIDTGSNLSLVRADVVNELGVNIRKSPVKFLSADDQNMACVGICELEVELTIGEVTKTGKFNWYVMSKLCVPALLGLEAQGWFRILSRASNRTIVFEDELSGIRVIRNTTIPARSEAVISATVPTNTKPDSTIVIDPFQFKSSILVANAINVVSKNHTVECLVANLLPNAIILPANIQLGCFTIITENTEEVKSHCRVNSILQLSGYNEKVKIGTNLNQNQVKELQVLIDRHVTAFSIEGSLGETGLIEHEIELLTTAKPVMEPLRRRPLTHKIEAQRQVDQMLIDGVIEHSNSPWASAYVLVKKKDQSLRLCIDFRKVNEQTKKNAYPMPNIEECLETLSGNKYFSSLDLASGYWQIKVASNSRELTAFRTEQGLYQFRRMPFGLCNAPASFQRLVNALFAGLKGIHLQVFIDDICVATKTWEEHLQLLEQVFLLLKQANLKLKASKCVFGGERIIFLGHELSAHGIRQDPAKLESIEKLGTPKDVNSLRRALGLFGYYRRFVPRYAEISAPLTLLLKKNANYIWEHQHQQAFEELRRELTRNALLTTFNHHDPLLLKTDASKLGLAGVLLQQQGDEWKLITCCSRRTTEAEQNYGVSDLEGAALVYSITKLRNYLLGKHFTVLTDHCALCSLNIKTPKSARLHRWRLILSEYNFNIKYIRGGLHLDVDCLSRAPVENDVDPYLDDKVLAAIQCETLPLATRDQNSCAMVSARDYRNWKEETNQDAEAEPHLIKARQRVKGYKIHQGCLYYEHRLYVPKTKRNEILSEYHADEPSCHGGIRATLDRMSTLWWPDMAEDVRKFIGSCPICQARKALRTAPAGSMYSFQAYEPFEIIAFDVLGALPPSINNNKFVIVGIDCFTRYIDAVAVENQKGDTFIKYFKDFIGRFGIPRCVLTDNSNFFRNSQMYKLAEQMSIELRSSTPDHHEGNAVVERVIGSLQEKLSLICHDPVATVDWEENLPMAVLSLNTSLHSTTKFTPFELLFGRKHQQSTLSIVENNNLQNWYGELREHRSEEMRADAIRSQSTTRQQAEQRFKLRHSISELEIGDLVLVREPSRRAKLQNRYISYPFKVVKKHNDVYELEGTSERSEKLQRHIRDLKVYQPRQTESLNESDERISLVQTIIDEKENKDMNKILILFSAFNCLVQTVAPIRFVEAPGIVWQDTKAYVSRGPTQFTFIMKLGDSCEALRQFKVNQPGELDNAILQCQQVFREQISDPLGKMAARKTSEPLVVIPNHPTTELQVRPPLQIPNNRIGVPNRGYPQSAQPPTSRGRRGVMDFIAGSVVTNLVETVLDRWWPNPTISTLEEKETLMDQKLELLNKQTNFSMLQTKALLEGQAIMKELVLNNVNAIKAITTAYPQLAIVAADLIARSHLVGSYIEQLAVSFRMQKPNFALLFMLFKLEAILDIDPESIIVNSAKFASPSANLIVVEFVARQRDRDMMVCRVSAFHVWANLLEPDPKLMAYTGPLFVLRNTTNNCIKGIQSPQQNYVSALCGETNYKDSRLANWKEIDHRDMKTEIIDAFPSIYVNCPLESITIDGETSKCPPFPFSLDYMKRFHTDSYEHSPSVVEVNLNTVITTNISIEAIHFKNVSHLTDKIAALDKVQALNAQIKYLQKEMSAVSWPNLEIKYKDTTSGLLVIMVGLVILVIYTCVKKGQRVVKAAELVRRNYSRENIRERRRNINQMYEQCNPPQTGLPMITWRS